MAAQFITNHNKEYLEIIHYEDIILKKLKEHYEYFDKKSMSIKLYFDTIDPSMDKNTKMWMNLIHSNLFSSYHCHDYYELNVILEGVCYELIDGRIYTLKKGDILIMPPNMVFHMHYLTQDSKGCNILVKSDYMTQLFHEIETLENNYIQKLITKSSFCILRSNNPHELLSYTDRIKGFYIEENKNQTTAKPPSSLSRMCCERLFELILLETLKGIENGSTSCEFSDVINTDYSPDDIILYIKNNYSTVTMPHLMTKFGYSKRHLHRIITKSTGYNFRMLINIERLKHAKTLLKNTVLSVEEIATLTGLESKEYFCNMFRKATGMTALEYRKKVK